jgi:hypothetical protein
MTPPDAIKRIKTTDNPNRLLKSYFKTSVPQFAAQAYRKLTSFSTATLSLIASFGACTRSCFVPRYRSVV